MIDGIIFVAALLTKPAFAQAVMGLVDENVLDPLGMRRSAMAWREAYENKVANGHGAFGRPRDSHRCREPDAAGSL